MHRTTTVRTALFLQDACYRHRFIRSNDLSTIVERPERLRALKVGFAAAIARIEQAATNDIEGPANLGNAAIADVTGDELAAALQKLDILQDLKLDIVDIIISSSSLDLLNNKAVKFVHGDIDGDVYLENLVKWTKESTDKIKHDGSEIPSHLSQGDLYLCPESLDAIQGALGTVCEAVDKIVAASRLNREEPPNESESTTAPTNAFVAIRPPGHHCGEDAPSGFCFVCNAYSCPKDGTEHMRRSTTWSSLLLTYHAAAHLSHGIKKVVIFDIDLHHGNGTQSLAWQINEETYRQKLEADAGAPEISPGLQIFYGSLHDILSFPCEDGNVSMVQAASVSIHGPHGQHIENIHLQQYQSEEDFWGNLYPRQYSKLLKKAEAFAKGADGEDVLVFISCGFDACEHEYPSMSRHNRRVPTSFYHRFAVEARRFASEFANGKLISILEGGYSDRALISGGMAHLSGLIDVQSLGANVDEEWWNIANLTSLERSTKKRRGGKLSVGGGGEKWLERCLAIFQSIDTVLTPSPSRVQVPLPPSSMTLRERKPVSTVASPKGSPQAPRRTKGKVPQTEKLHAGVSMPPNGSVDDILKKFEDLDLEKTQAVGEELALNTVKKVPRVILRLKEPGES